MILNPERKLTILHCTVKATSWPRKRDDCHALWYGAARLSTSCL